mmetsp:Transcript_25421/g.33188  ORF Transcript_25421/g.33188 Transcript_25421/m.33188 type:complete len:263 (+) Transcript_25421:86-874(+)
MERDLEVPEDLHKPLMASSSDPFYVVKDEIQAKIEYSRVRHTRFQDLLQNTNTATNSEFRDIRKALIRELASAEKKLSNLNLTVEAVEGNREQFSHIDDAELSERKAFIIETKKTIKHIASDIRSDKARKKMEQDERQHMARSQPESNLGAKTAFQSQNTDYVLDQRARAQVTLKQQDEELEEIGMAVDRVGDMAGNIKDELESQKVMLNSLETDMDDTTTRLNTVMGHLGKLLKTKDRCQLMSIIILTITLAVLVILVIYT